MAQFLMLAYDGTDADAPARRRAARQAHFEHIKPMVDKREICAGGAILDDNGTMIGSALFVEFPAAPSWTHGLSESPTSSRRCGKELKSNRSVWRCSTVG